MENPITKQSRMFINLLAKDSNHSKPSLFKVKRLDVLLIRYYNSNVAMKLYVNPCSFVSY